MQFPIQLLFLLSSATSIYASQFPLSLTSAEDRDVELSASTESELLYLHRKLVEIESISGNEKQVGDWLASYLEERGLTVEKQHVSPDRFNVLAYPGKDRKTKILVTSHIDTVPPFIPYSLQNSNTEIWGRGTVDAKACVAAQIIAALNIINSTSSSSSSSSPSLSLLFVVGEETAGTGMLYFSSHAPTNYTSVLFGEPTEGRLVSGHKGMLSFSLTVTGKAAHSGYPWLGLSATSVLVEALSALQALEPRLPASDTLGATTLNIGRMQGGVAANVVAEHASADVSVRIAAGSPDVIMRLVAAALAPVKDRTETAGGALETAFSNRAYGPVLMDTDIPGFEKDAMSVNYGTDIPNLAGPHKKYLWGPGTIFVAHGPQEHLKVKELEDAVGVYEKMIKVILER